MHQTILPFLTHHLQMRNPGVEEIKVHVVDVSELTLVSVAKTNPITKPGEKFWIPFEITLAPYKTVEMDVSKKTMGIHWLLTHSFSLS